MSPEQLKASILHFAIQGKSVEQRPEEGTAEELYQLIQSEKQKMIKEGIIKKEKPLAEITEEEIPFDIPESWKWCRLSEVIDVRDGTHDSPKYVHEGIPLVTSKNLSNGTIDYGNIKYITQADANKINERSAVDDGDILFAMIGTIGNPVLVKKDREFCIKNMALFKRYTDTDIDMNYMYWFFYFVQYSLKAEASGGVQSFISLTRFREYPFPLPPIEEQHRIVAKIEELLPYVDRYAEAYEKLEQFNAKFPEEMKKSILQYAIQGKLVEQRLEEGTAEELYQQIQDEKQRLIKEGKIKKEKPLAEITEDEIPFDIPESWKWVRISEIMTLENGDRSKKYPVESDYVDFGIPFFGAKDIVNGKMSFDDVRYISQEKYDELGNGKLVDKDLICLLRGSVGKNALFLADEKHNTGFICAQMLIIRAINTELIPYLMQYFMSPLYMSLVEAKTTGTAVRQLPAKEIGNMLVPLPPLAEQERIASRVNEILPICEVLVK